MEGIDIYTKLMYHGNGLDGSQTITDSSGNGHTGTCHNHAQLDTADKEFGTASMLFDGIDDYISIPDHTDFEFGAGDFTIDFWTKNDNQGNEGLFAKHTSGSFDEYYCSMTNVDAGLFHFKATTSGTAWDIDLVSNTMFPRNTWTHVAIVRYGSSWKLYINGVAQTSTFTNSGTIPTGTNDLWIGQYNNAGWLNGWIDEFRISKGIARWTANFTPPTEEYTIPQVIETDTLLLSDEIGFGSESKEVSDSLSLLDTIFVNERPQRLNETDTLLLSDIIDVTKQKSKEEVDTITLSDEIETRIPIEFLHNKFNFLLQTIKNINNKFSFIKGLTQKCLNKIRIRLSGLYKCKNDFRMRLAWQVPSNGGIQSLGKEYIKVYISTVEQTDVDVDSISITKGVNNASSANLSLGRAYDATAPLIESPIEIRYGNNVDRTKNWSLFEGYITEIIPTDNPECIQLNCQDEMWKQNQTRVYFQVGHIPFGIGNDEIYYTTILNALSVLGIGVDFGNFIPQTMNCWGKSKSEIITELITNAGNFGWFYDKDEYKIWRAGEGSIINLEAQEIGKNLGLYQILNHSFKTDATNIINQLKVQMGNFVNQIGNRQFAGSEYKIIYLQPEPLWNPSLEVLAKDSNDGYGFDHHNPAITTYNNVFKKYKLTNYTDIAFQLIKWSDRYEPKVQILDEGYNWICDKTVGQLQDGFTIDYKNGIFTLSEPVYWYQLNDKGEVSAIRRATVLVDLVQKQYSTNNNSISSPLNFITTKLGSYPITKIGDLSLSGLGIQWGGVSIDENGNRKIIPSWNDTVFAQDNANWQLSKTCDEKITGNISLTLDAICFYNIDLSRRIQINGIMNTPLNIIGMTYNLSDFTVNLQLENSRSYTRTVSIQSRGEDYF